MMSGSVVSLPLSETLASPLARRMVVAAGLEARQISGSGRNARIGKADVETALGDAPQRSAGPTGALVRPVGRVALAIEIETANAERLCTHLNTRVQGGAAIGRDDILICAVGAALRRCGVGSAQIALGLFSDGELIWRLLPQAEALPLSGLAAARKDRDGFSTEPPAAEEGPALFGVVVSADQGLYNIAMDPVGGQEALLSWTSQRPGATAVAVSIVGAGETFGAALTARVLAAFKALVEEPVLLLG